MGIREDFLPYTAPDGSISGVRNPRQASGNSLLFSAERLICLIQNGAYQSGDLNAFVIMSMKRIVAWGLYKRTPPGTPFSEDQEGADDYYGLAAVHQPTAYLIFKTGKDRKFRWGPFRLPYYFPTKGQDDRDVSAWFGRFPGFVAHLRVCAGATVWPWHALAWAYSVAYGPKAGDQDSWILTWIMVWANKNPGFLARRAIHIRQARLIKVYPGGIRQVLTSYFGDATHPVARWAR